MRLRASFSDLRAGCQGLHRPKAPPAQACGWSLGAFEQRTDVVSAPSKPAKLNNGCLAVSANITSAEPLVKEDDLFLFESEGDLEETRHAERKPKQTELIPAQYTVQAQGNMGRLEMLDRPQRRSAPMGIPIVLEHGSGKVIDAGATKRADAPQFAARTKPIAIPGFGDPSINRDRQKMKEEFVPPHIFISQMNNVEHFPHCGRPCERSALRARTLVLAKTGYLDGYTEMGQRPEKHHAIRHKYALSA